MTCTNQTQGNYLLNNTDVLNQIILDRSTGYSVVKEVHHQHDGTKNIEHIPACIESDNFPLDRKLMEQMQSLQTVINLLTELHR